MVNDRTERDKLRIEIRYDVANLSQRFAAHFVFWFNVDDANVYVLRDRKSRGFQQSRSDRHGREGRLPSMPTPLFL
jgi:hypothetical protein